jgi:ADP-ribose pyrophosphatase
MQKVLPPNAILIPDNAKLAFAGEIFDVYQWPQTMFDGRTATFELLKRPDTVQVIVIRDNKLLLVNDAQPGRGVRLHLPGGRADEDDASWLAAAQRELLEEAGFVCSDWRLIAVDQPVPKLEWFIPMFLAQTITEEHAQQLDPGGEKIELVWKDFNEVQSLALSGTEPTMNYLLPLLSRVKTVEELSALPAFIGKEVDR